MATFRDDMPLIAGVNADWDDINTYEQVKHPDADISPIRMKTMHHLPQNLFRHLARRTSGLPSIDSEHILGGA